MVPDRLIPGTLNVGHTLPTITQAFIYTLAIDVDVTTLILMILAAVARRLAGRGHRGQLAEAQRPDRDGRRAARRRGPVCLAATCRRITGQPNLLSGGEVGTTHLEGMRLVIGLAGNFALGALMTLGIGMYAPCMILVGLLGMNADGRVPDHDGILRVPDARRERAVRREARLSLRPALGLAIGGIPAVLIAALIVKEMDVTIDALARRRRRVHCRTMMLRSALRASDSR